MVNDEKISGLFISLRTALARAVSRMVPPREVEDIVQETYVRVCQVENRDEIQYPRSFMLRIAQNLALDHLKKAETRLTVSLDGGDDDTLPELTSHPDDTFERVAANQEFSHFCEAVRQLPLQCRKAFILKKVYGYSQREIATQLCISENTVEKHIATGLKRCAQLMAARRNAATDPAQPLPTTGGKL